MKRGKSLNQVQRHHRGKERRLKGLALYHLGRAFSRLFHRVQAEEMPKEKPRSSFEPVAVQ